MIWNHLSHFLVCWKVKNPCNRRIKQICYKFYERSVKPTWLNIRWLLGFVRWCIFLKIFCFIVSVIMQACKRKTRATRPPVRTCNSFKMWSIYEIIHMWTAVVDESEEWSSQLISNLSNWKEEALKNQGFNGIRTRDLRDTGAMLYQLS